MAKLSLTVNGRRRSVEADPDTPLLYVLRNDLGLRAAKYGCGLGQCGACTVQLGGRAVPSCITPVSAALRQPITTVEGLGSPERPHPLQAAFIQEQAAQCGYCIAGMVMSAKALLDRVPRPTEAQIKEALAGNLCRCGTYPRILAAVLQAAKAGNRERPATRRRA
jgi:nicotinate dehydrogenase subunit A